MDALIKKIQVVPKKLDNEGTEKEPENATITLDVPIDTIAQKDCIKALLDILSNEWVMVEITEKQTTLNLKVASQ